jgi:hypothetical protein
MGRNGPSGFGPSLRSASLRAEKSNFLSLSIRLHSTSHAATSQRRSSASRSNSSCIAASRLWTGQSATLSALDLRSPEGAMVSRNSDKGLVWSKGSTTSA